MASKGYPAKPVTGALIEGLGRRGPDLRPNSADASAIGSADASAIASADASAIASAGAAADASAVALEPILEGPLVFHAATQRDQGQLRCSGGRVLCVVGLGADAEQARLEAYRRVSGIHFEGAQFRRDIGTRPGFSASGM